MKKISAQRLKEWFADPEAELENFRSSGQAFFNIVFPDEGLVTLNQRDVGHLLEEFAEIRRKEEEEKQRLLEELKKKSSVVGMKIG
jgi:hypothetical protein